MANNEIKLIDILNLPEEKWQHLRLVFNSDWEYTPENRTEEVKAKLGEKSRDFDLLNMYGHGEAEIVKESVKTHKPSRRRFRTGDYVLCFIPFDDEENWLLVNAYKVLDDTKYLVDVDEEAFSEMSAFLGRLIITWNDRKTRNIVMVDKSMISKLTVKTILEQPYYKSARKFPGYENVDISWRQLDWALELESWKTALENEKGVYLITDVKTGKHYVGSATGDKKGMLLGRWRDYRDTLHGGNDGLKKLIKEKGEDYIKENFRYTILEHFSSATEREIVESREKWWKKILLSKESEFGYNEN